MADFSNKFIPTESMGARLGSSLGQGLEAIASARLQKHVEDRKRMETANALKAINPNLTHEHAQLISALSPELLKEYFKGTMNPKQPLVSQTFGEPSFQDYSKQVGQKTEAAESGLELINRLRQSNESGELNKGFLGFNPYKGEASQGFESDVQALEGLSKQYPRLKGISKRLKYGNSKETISKELEDIEKDFKKENTQKETLQKIIQANGGKVPSDWKQLLKQAMKQQQGSIEPQVNISDQQPQDMQHNRSGFMETLSDLPRAGAGLLAKGAQGLGEGVTGTVAAPFNIANLVSGGNIPVPEAIRSLQSAPEKIVKGLTGELTTPKSDIESALGETVADVASFLSPAGLLGAAGKGLNFLGKGSKWLDTAAKVLKIPVKTAAGVAGLSNAAKFLTKQVGGGEGEQAAAKIGTMLAVPIIGSRLLGSEVAKLSDAAIKAAPAESNVVSNGLFKQMGNLYKKISGLPESETTKSLLTQIETMPGARFPVKSLVKFEQDLAAAAKNPTIGKSIEKVLPTIEKEINTALSQAGKKYPEFGKAFDQYKDLFNATQQSNKVAEFVGKNLTGGIIRNPWATLGFALLGVPKYKTIGAALPAALGAGEVERLVQMIYKSPEFRKVAGGFINAALQGNAKQVNQLAHKLDKMTAEFKTEEE